MKLRIGRIIAYIIGLVLTVFMFGYFRSFVFLMFFVIELVTAAADIASVIFLVQQVEFALEAPVISAEKKDPIPVIIRINNPTIVPSFELNVNLSTENSFYGTSGQTQIALPVRAHGETMRRFPLDFSLLGNYDFHVDLITVRDLLGFCDVKKAVDTDVAITVFPKKDRTIVFDPDRASAGMTEADESDRRGNDFSDVSEIREYVPGDRPRDIHWKLSAKKDELMVKQRSAMSDQQLVVVVEFTDILSDNDSIVEESYALGKELVRSGINASLMWWNAAEEDFHARRLSSIEDVDASFIEMFSGRAARADDIDMLMRSVHPEIVNYLKVCYSDGQVQEIAVNGS